MHEIICRITKSIFIILMLVASPAFAMEVMFEIPSEFHGAWVDDLDKCGYNKTIGSFHPDLMAIDAKSVKYYESGGKVISAVSAGISEIAMILGFYSEDDQYIVFKHYQLSSDKNSISELSGREKTGVIYHRCQTQATNN